MDSFRFQAGDTPVLLSIPHGGTGIPADIAATMTETGRSVPDTDWHLARLYDFVPALGIGCLAANLSRYVIDLNRDIGGAVLYPGADNTELCPVTTFDHEPIYRDGMVPDAAEIARRIELYYRPYHRQIAAELSALKDRFGVAILFEAHSIRSVVPRFFGGRLPDFNVGTAEGRTASPDLVDRLMRVLTASDRYQTVLNGRFKGGYITRTYGRPEDGIHAVQLEMAQCCYMDETPPFAYREDRASEVRPVLERLMAALVDWAREQAAERRRAVQS